MTDAVSWNTTKAVEMWLAGQSAAVIWPTVGAPSRSAVIGYMHRNGHKRPSSPPEGRERKADPWTPALHAEVAKQWLEGVSAKRIAASVNHVVTFRAIIARMHRQGVKAPNPALKARAATMTFVQRPEDRKPPSRAAVEAAEALPVDLSGLKTLVGRGPHDCCWPVGAAHPVRGQLYCGKSAEADGRQRRYCKEHTPDHAIAVTPLRWNDKSYRRPARAQHESELDLRELFA